MLSWYIQRQVFLGFQTGRSCLSMVSCPRVRLCLCNSHKHTNKQTIVTTIKATKLAPVALQIAEEPKDKVLFFSLPKPYPLSQSVEKLSSAKPVSGTKKPGDCFSRLLTLQRQRLCHNHVSSIRHIIASEMFEMKTYYRW